MSANIIVDFDSTIVSGEVLEVMFRYGLSASKDRDRLVEEIKKITDAGMNGEISFNESITRRTALLNLNDAVIAKTIEHFKSKVSASFKETLDQLLEHNFYVISGGFNEVISPILIPLGVDKSRIRANSFVYYRGEYLGIDRSNPLAHDLGKVKVAESLGLKGTTIVVGDGYSDYQIKEKGLAETFIYYAEHVRRAKVIALADIEITNFLQLLPLLN